MWKTALPRCSSKSKSQNHFFSWELSVAPTQCSDLLRETALLLFPYGVLMNYLMTLSHQDFWNNRTIIYLYTMMRTLTEASTAIGKVHQDPGVSLCPAVAFLTLSYHEAFFFFFFQNIPPEDKSCPGLRCQGESRSKKRVRHLDSYSPNQLSVGLYYMCKAKSWSEKTTYYRVLNINTILKYLFFVILILKQVIRRDQLQNHSTI